MFYVLIGDFWSKYKWEWYYNYIKLLYVQYINIWGLTAKLRLNWSISLSTIRSIIVVEESRLCCSIVRVWCVQYSNCLLDMKRPSPPPPSDTVAVAGILLIVILISNITNLNGLSSWWLVMWQFYQYFQRDSLLIGLMKISLSPFYLHSIHPISGVPEDDLIAVCSDVVVSEGGDLPV